MLCAFLDKEISTAGFVVALNDGLRQGVREWLEFHRQAFYGGCRMDGYSTQVNEFVEGLNYYLAREYDGREDS